MTLAIVYSRANVGMDAPLVVVEVHLSRGMPGLNIVGLPETAVKESKDRVRSALLNTCFEFPRYRMTINLAPADLPKEGGRFDLPIALGVLAASGQILPEKLKEFEFVGELALSGELRGVRGALPVVLAAARAKRKLIIPQANAAEAALVKQAEVFSASHLLEVCAYLKDEAKLPGCERVETNYSIKNPPDLADVHGQPHARRALEIAAAGNHSLLFMGSPGTGKTMLASRLPGILPPLSDEQSLEVAALNSISRNGFDYRQWQQVPFRSPHHSSSSIALVGGGRPPQPGEISLAHQGVLFLDELPEFNRNVLESLREPLESGCITISRAAYQTIFPARFQLIAAMNPCPCGFFGSSGRTCRCSSLQVQRYLGKLSGPFLDRIDMQVDVPNLPPELLSIQTRSNEDSASVKKRVLSARERQYARQGKLNCELSVQDLENFCVLTNDVKIILNKIMTKFNLSARVFHRIIKVTRTIADLMSCDMINAEHVGEALNYRALDRARNVNLF
ncbi:MAG TPA: YifB family Mg chelatase-like AAA ATPase [Gammaproteobacteria bacterium]|nr:YifB family Mg chelatase-like AAA ATPase [Gammaproteobacteria bacterium]